MYRIPCSQKERQCSAPANVGSDLPQRLAQAPPCLCVRKVGPEGARQEVSGVCPLPVHQQKREKRSSGP